MMKGGHGQTNYLSWGAFGQEVVVQNYEHHIIAFLCPLVAMSYDSTITQFGERTTFDVESNNTNDYVLVGPVYCQ